MKSCPRCKSVELKESASVCPYCGFIFFKDDSIDLDAMPQSRNNAGKKNGKLKWWMIVLPAVVVVVAIIALLLGILNGKGRGKNTVTVEESIVDTESVAGATDENDTEAPIGTALLHGAVWDDEDNSSLSGVSVSLYGASDMKNSLYSGITDEEGRFSIESVAAGDYILYCELNGYANFEDSISLSDSEEKICTVSMIPIQAEATEVAEADEIGNSEFIIPDSDVRYLTYDDLNGLTAEECRLARNELFARHGRRFQDVALQEYFNSKSWYNGTVDPEDFNDAVFNEYEVANRDLIVQYEKEMGYR